MFAFFSKVCIFTILFLTKLSKFCIQIFVKTNTKLFQVAHCSSCSRNSTSRSILSTESLTARLNLGATENSAPVRQSTSPVRLVSYLNQKVENNKNRQREARRNEQIKGKMGKIIFLSSLPIFFIIEMTYGKRFAPGYGLSTGLKFICFVGLFVLDEPFYCFW